MSQLAMRPKILARSLLNIPVQKLWDGLYGDFTIVFDDGEIETNAKEVIFSHYTWGFHREYPNTPLTKANHIASILKGGRLTNKTHIRLIEVSYWQTFNAYGGYQVIPQEVMTKLVYDIVNNLYNDLATLLGEFNMFMDITDFIEVMSLDVIKEAFSNAPRNPEGIAQIYGAITKVLKTPEYIPNNALCKISLSGIVRHEQMLQCLGPRGYATDIDSYVFKTPVFTSFLQGHRKIADSMIESRTASKALYFSKAPLKQAEYFSRKLQILCQPVKNLYHTDCGSQEYQSWRISAPDDSREEDGETAFRSNELFLMAGKHYLNEETGKLDTIKATDKHLYGKTVKLRSVIAGCAHPDPYGICSTCFGLLSTHVPLGTNIGHLCSTYMAAMQSQLVLSTKHHDGSAGVKTIILTNEAKKIFKTTSGGFGYTFNDTLRNKKVRLIIAAQEADGLTDIKLVKNVDTILTSRVTQLTTIGVEVTDSNGPHLYVIPVSIDRRKASFTYPMLEKLKNNFPTLDDKNNYVIEMDDWDYSKELMSLPPRHANMSDHSQDVAEIIESRVEIQKKRGALGSPQATLVELFELVNSKLNVPLAVLETMLLGALIRDPDTDDYQIPKAGSKSQLGVSKVTIPHRSLSATLAYEYQKDAIYNPKTFFDYYKISGAPRVSHPMDVFVMPKETLEHLG